MCEEKKVTDQYLELHKLAVEMADRAAARRASFLTFPFTANTALFAVLFSGNLRSGIWVVSLVGLVISATWWLILKSYRDIIIAKFRLINEMEKNLEVQIYHEEWEGLRHQYMRKGLHLQYNTVEKVAPPIFASLYIVLLITTLLS